MTTIWTPRVKPQDVCVSKPQVTAPPNYTTPVVGATIASIAGYASPANTGRPQTAPGPEVSNYATKQSHTGRDPVHDGDVIPYKPGKRQFAGKQSTGSPVGNLRGKGSRPEITHDSAGFVPSLKPERPLLKKSDSNPQDQLEYRRTSHRTWTPHSHMLQDRDPLGQKGYSGVTSVKNSVPAEHRPERRMYAEKTAALCPTLDQMVEMGTTPDTRRQRQGPAALDSRDTAHRVMGTPAVDGSVSTPSGNSHFMRRPRDPRANEHEARTVIQYQHSGGICPDTRATMDKRDERRQYENSLSSFHQNTCMSARAEAEKNKVRASSNSNILGDFMYERRPAWQ